MQENEKIDITKIDETPKDTQKWTTLTQKVYELELLISGAGIYLFSTLFYNLDDIWQYYNYNFLDKSDFVAAIASVVYLISKGSTLTLWIGFILHFVLRAFWITMVGMMNLFPKGINYKNLPKKYSETYISYLKEKISPTEIFITAIDRTCSAILLSVFLLALMLMTGASIYLFFIFGYDFLKIFLGEKHKENIVLVYVSLGVFIIFVPYLISLTFLLLKRNQKNAINNYPLKIELYYHSYNYWVFSRTLQRIGFVLKTNVHKQVIRYSTIGMGIVITITIMIYEYYQNAERQYFFTQNSAQYLNPDVYENMRHSEKYVKKVSIQQDVITSPLLKIFLAYRKDLEEYIENDETLKRELEIEEKKYQKNIKNSQTNERKSRPEREEEQKKSTIEKQKKSIIYWGKFFKIYVNDSLCNNPNMVMQRHPRNNAKGFGVYMQPKNLKIGKNTLNIYIPKIKGNTTKKQTEKNADMLWIEIPFWYFPA